MEYRDIAATEFEPPADFKKLAPKFRGQKGTESPVPGAVVPQAKTSTEASLPPAPGQEAVSSSDSQPEPDTTQPRLPNDSATDGTVSHADQPGLNQ